MANLIGEEKQSILNAFIRDCKSDLPAMVEEVGEREK